MKLKKKRDSLVKLMGALALAAVFAFGAQSLARADPLSAWHGAGQLIEVLRSHLLALPDLVKFAVIMAVIVGVPALAQLVRLPGMIGLLCFGVLLGPHGLDLYGEDPRIADFFGELGKLLLMFSAGLEVDIHLFRQAQTRALIFGVVITTVPQVFGTVLGLAFGYPWISAIVIGSLLASHTLLSLPIVNQLGATRLEPVVITLGATVVSDTLSLIVFAICVSTYTTGFSLVGLSAQIVEIAVFVPLVLVGVSRAGAWLLRRFEGEEEAQFVVMLGIMAVTGAVADAINLPGIVGAFLAGLAVNGAVERTPVKEKVGFIGQALFIPCFFIVTGLLIDPVAFANSIGTHFALVCGLVGVLVLAKGIAAAGVGRAFGYPLGARLTMWAMTLPQVAATLAATLVAYNTRNVLGERLLDDRMLNAVLVLMVATSSLGPLLTERFAPRMLRVVAEP